MVTALGSSRCPARLPALDQWLHFLTENPSGFRSVSGDTWDLFLHFPRVLVLPAATTVTMRPPQVTSLTLWSGKRSEEQDKREGEVLSSAQGLRVCVPRSRLSVCARIHLQPCNQPRNQIFLEITEDPDVFCFTHFSALYLKGL